MSRSPIPFAEPFESGLEIAANPIPIGKTECHEVRYRSQNPSNVVENCNKLTQFHQAKLNVTKPDTVRRSLQKWSENCNTFSVFCQNLVETLQFSDPTFLDFVSAQPRQNFMSAQPWEKIVHVSLGKIPQGDFCEGELCVIFRKLVKMLQHIADIPRRSKSEFRPSIF